MPETNYQHRQIILAPPNDLKNGEQLGFTAQSVRVDNPTPAWWFLPDQQVTIAPYTIGAIIPVLGTEKATIIYQAPPGISQPTTSNVGTASFTYLEEANAPNPGLASYGLVPPGANSDLLVLPNGIATNYDLKGPTDKLTIFLFLNAGIGTAAFLNIQVTIAVLGGVALTFDNFSVIIGSSVVVLNQTAVCPIQLPYSLPARARLTLTQSIGSTIFGVVLY